MTNKKEMPHDFWNHGINPILGYKYKKPGDGKRRRDKFEYPKEDDYKVDDGVIAYFTR